MLGIPLCQRRSFEFQGELIRYFLEINNVDVKTLWEILNQNLEDQDLEKNTVQLTVEKNGILLSIPGDPGYRKLNLAQCKTLSASLHNKYIHKGCLKILTGL